MTRRNRTAAILAAVLALILLFSALFIVLEADHDCHGENCRVCMQIRLCEGLLRQAAVFPIPAASGPDEIHLKSDGRDEGRRGIGHYSPGFPGLSSI